jgi:retron-type reverse transcriptase
MKKTALGNPSENDLMEQIVDERNMLRAWRNVKANKGAPGPDGITLDEFEQNFRQEWPTIRQQLLDGTYQPGAARRKSIPKPDGSERHLGIPNVQERLLQQAILQVLTPIFDPEFSESSFGFRPKRSAHGAAKRIQTHIRSGYRHCVDMDFCIGDSIGKLLETPLRLSRPEVAPVKNSSTGCNMTCYSPESRGKLPTIASCV